jgi:hypothetical protein
VLAVGASNTSVWRVERARALAMVGGHTPFDEAAVDHSGRE